MTRFDRSRCGRRLALAISLVVSASCGRGRDAADSSVSAAPTYATAIKPLVERRCAGCHQPGQAAPFSLLTYADVAKRAKRIADVTGRRVMPPWLPNGSHGEFVGDRRLSDVEIETIRRWVALGSPEGAPADAIAVSGSAWALGTPDLVVEMPRAYLLQPRERDLFRNFVLPLNNDSGRYVRAIEFRPGRTRAIHHAMIAVDRTRASRRKDGADGAPGYDGMFTPGAQSPDGHFLGWTPGRGPVVSPETLPWRLDPGSDLVVQLHLLARAEPDTIAPSIGLYFTDTPPSATPILMRLGSKAIDIPAGASNYATEDHFVLPVDVTLLSVYPHAHYLAREMTAEAVLPDGQRRSLLHIPQWDFHWQQDYRYAAPMALPRGTSIRMRFTWDNPGHREHSTHAVQAAPKRVLYGPEATDEMGDLWFQLVPTSADDGRALTASLARHETERNIDGAEMLVARVPGDAGHYVSLGNAYADAGRLDEATDVLTRGLRIAPGSAEAHSGLAMALFRAGRPADALPHFLTAARVDPGDDRAFFNLASALAATGRPSEAITAFRRAIALNPAFAEAHNNLGVLLEQAGRRPDAFDHFERAVRSNAAYADARSNLGAALASQGRLREAEQQLRRAVELEPTHRMAAENLRAVQMDLGTGR